MLTQSEVLKRATIYVSKIGGGVANKASTYASQILKTLPSKSAKGKYDTSQSLYNLAVQSGLQDKADKLLAGKGEDTKKIFSGGFISDIFDVLNALQYGVVGILKGKSFGEGVKTRQSFSDKDALGDLGLPGVIGGIALDIAVDPLTYIAPWTIAKKISPLMKAGKAAKAFVFGKKATKAIEEGKSVFTGFERTYETLEGGTKIGKWFADKFVWMFGKDPIYKEAYQRSIKNIAVGTMNIADLTKGVANITQETAAKILTKDETGRFIRKGLDEVKKILKPEEFEGVSKLYAKIDDLGKQAVDLGLLSKEKFEENLGEYIKNAYTEYELAKKKGIFGFMKAGIKGIKARKVGLTVEKMKELGQIDNPAYLLFKSAFDLTKDVENAKLFREVAAKLGSDIAQEGFKQLPKTTRLGELAGKFVPQNVFDAIQEITNPVKDMVGKELMANFKFMKVILSPATHGRNVVSNKILNWWKLGMNPLDPRVIKTDFLAGKEIFAKGGKWINEAKTVGYNVDTFAANELKSLLDAPEALGFGKKLGNKWAKIKNTLGNIYQGEENGAKLSAFIFNRTYKGMGIEDAWKAAESATFNYAQVTPFIRNLRTALWGFPFITFATKAAPIAVETALKYPRRISAFGKIKQGIENLADIETTARERASEPDWVRDGFYIKLPMKDKYGRSSYFDLSYIIPFGDLVSGQFFERTTMRETGLPEPPASAMLRKSPLIGFIREISRNQDFYGDKIWQESDSTEKQLGDLFRHLSKTYLPPLVADQIPGGHMEQGGRRIKGIRGVITAEDQAKQQRTLMQEILRNVGAKIQPIDVDIQESLMEWEKKKALKTLLEESGVLKEFTASYVPK